MKKLNLKSNAFNKGEVLTRSQLKNVMGGTTVPVTGPHCQTGVKCEVVTIGTDADGEYFESHAYGTCSSVQVGSSVTCNCDAGGSDGNTKPGVSNCWTNN